MAPREYDADYEVAEIFFIGARLAQVLLMMRIKAMQNTPVGLMIKRPMRTNCVVYLTCKYEYIMYYVQIVHYVKGRPSP